VPGSAQGRRLKRLVFFFFFLHHCSRTPTWGDTYGGICEFVSKTL
jgi:hypothetical protein